MIDETIGSIGSTQGVSESSRPAMKNAPTIGQNEPPRRTASMPVASAAAAAACSTLVASDGAGAERCIAGGSTRAVPAPPKPSAATARRALHRRIAQARVGAALAGDDEAELRAGLLDRDRIVHRVAIGLDVLLEGLVELHLARREIAGAPSAAPLGANLNCSR